jgi:exodeoxyribonuclease VII large subunit
MGLDPDSADPATTRETLTVSLLNRAVAGLLSRGFPLVRVAGEVSGFTRASSGHWYFALKDDSAQVRCVMFRGRNALVPRGPRDGDAVELLAQVTLYEPRGEYQLVVESIRAAGAGRLFEEFVRLRERLGAEGLFDEARKRPLPALPRAVGVITSPQAAALRDVLTTLQRRAPYCRLVVYPVPVQGEGAARAIATMLGTASARGEVDVLLLVRGGGSIEDLWSFNEEVVARSIRACRIPVVVGVGHESDFTIADFAADVRAPTPTAAAAIAAPEAAVLSQGVLARDERLRRALKGAFDKRLQRLDYAVRALASPRAPLAGLHARIEQLHARAAGTQARRLAHRVAALKRAQQQLERARPALAAARQSVADLRARLAARSAMLAQRLRARFERLAGAVAQLDPTAVLTRGYSIVRDADGSVVTSARQLHVGQSIGLVLADGGAQARVEDVAPPRDTP